MTTEFRAAVGHGVIGRFWVITSTPPPAKLDDDDASVGHLSLADGLVELKITLPPAVITSTLEHFFAGDQSQPDSTPQYIFGITECGTCLLPNITGSRTVRTLGPKESFRIFRGDALAMKVQNPFGPKIYSLSTRFPHAEWADLNPLRERVHHKQNRATGLDLELRPTSKHDCGRVGSVALRIQGAWEQTTVDSYTTSVRTGLEVITETTRPRDHQEHVEVALAVQDLLSLAYDGFVPAWGARVRLEGDRSSATDTWFYHRELVESLNAGTAGQGRSQQQSPFFTLDDLGGPTALARWGALTRRYPDASNAIRVRDRTPTNPTKRMVELGAAIEQYVSEVKKEGKKAGKPPFWVRHGKTHEAALGKHAGPAFAAFVGDSDKWARLFHAAYLGEKHNTGVRTTGTDLSLLLTSGQLLLMVILLDRAARSHKPSDALLADVRIERLGVEIQALVASAK